LHLADVDTVLLTERREEGRVGRGKRLADAFAFEVLRRFDLRVCQHANAHRGFIVHDGERAQIDALVGEQDQPWR